MHAGTMLSPMLAHFKARIRLECPLEGFAGKSGGILEIPHPHLLADLGVNWLKKFQIFWHSKNTVMSSSRRSGEEANQLFIDDELDKVAKATGRTKILAQSIGTELVESTVRLNEIEGKMDSVQGRLDSMVARTKALLVAKSTWLWIGCIVLTIIVIILFALVFMGL
jgi:hypothetical protein